MPDYIIRPLRREEFELLKDFCYEAIFVPEGSVAPPHEVVNDPALRVYYEAFGSRYDDRAWCAEVEAGVVGCVWCRSTAGFGSVAEGIPELAMAVKKPYRKKGIGSLLLQIMLESLKAAGYKGASLSVQKNNFAYQIYLKAGFRTVRETPDEYIMVWEADTNSRN